MAGSRLTGEVTQSIDDLLSVQENIHVIVLEEQDNDVRDEEEDSPIFRLNNTRKDSPIFGPSLTQSSERVSATENSTEDLLTFPESWRTSPLAGSTRVTHDLVNERQQPTSSERKQKIAWPKMNDKGWTLFDEDLYLVLQSTLIGAVGRKLEALTSLTYTLGNERFGLENKPNLPQPPPVPNRRLCEIKKIRLELRSLRKQYKQSSTVEKEGIKQLRQQIRSRLMSLTNAERLRRKRREKTKKRTAFISNPYKFTKELFGEEKCGKLESSRNEVEENLKETHSDPHRSESLGECGRIQPVDEPAIPLNMKEPTWKEINDVVKKARSCSAPGPSGIPYKVYKKCPKLLRTLWSLLRVVWRKGSIPNCWQTAEGCLIPKEKNSKNITQFRTISLLSVEGKIFFSILAKRMTTYMIENKYIDTSVQKGGIPGFSGCAEHTSALTQLLHEARINQKDLTVVWLDLANAYGSIPHQLILEALQHYHVPEQATNLVTSYINNIHLRFSCSRFTTDLVPLEKGIVTGCTISVILFVMGMNMIIRAAERESRGPQTNAGIRLPPNRGFMDDMTITTETHIQTRWILHALDETVSWAWMLFKPRKSRCLVVRKGKVTDRFKLTIQKEEIPSLVNNPVKCLGKWFDSTLKDTKSQGRLKQHVEEGLKRIDKSELPGKYKAWIFQHGLLARLIWPLMVNEIPISLVEKMEHQSSKLQIPFNSLVEEYKVAKARLLLTLRDSSDEKISGARIEVRTGRKWSVKQAVDQAESSLKLQDIVGTTNKSREGLGIRFKQRWRDSDKVERRSMVQIELRTAEDETRSSRSVQLGSQGSWMKWNLPERQLTWQELWSYEPLQLSFLLRSVYDLLPSPTNLKLWKLSEDPSCPLWECRIITPYHVIM
ncbi:uncharacterized protein LOC132744948 [Ruditapes philippinarum]|uniref:uncharacterized protein LOC132744948 n=1 Tax=Ruditapes philippinarum TaxID=129788 RepID=UPI00295C1AB9|nr:uncharacterized protein LOC132744948 [Ruditapes philippinarum]